MRLVYRGEAITPYLPSNEAGSLRCLESLNRRLKRDGHLDEYDAVIRTQLQDGIVESSETTKMWVVYDASARADPSAPSLNDCLNSGPTLQNELWDVLIQQRAFPVMVSSDISQALLQIRVKEAERMYYDFIGVRMIVHPLRRCVSHEFFSVLHHRHTFYRQ